jgi:hypothetical protein
MTRLAGGRALLGAIPLIVAAGLLFAFYLWTASAGLPLGFGEPQDRPYNLLTQALLRGQLHIAVEPRPELFELTEPYRPGRNAPYRYHDASLYQGRYYLYFGVVPVVVAFAPWRLVGLGDLPEPAAAAAFALVGFVFSALLLGRLLRDHLGGPPRGVPLTLAFVVLGLSNVAPFILRSAHVYEVAIAAGYAFTAGAAWLFATAGTGGSWSLRRLALGGLFLGLAVGCRPNLLFLVPFLPLLALASGRLPSLKAAMRPGLTVLAPLAVCGIALGLYNHARFGSWTEFGTRYQLVGVEPIAQLETRAMVPTLFYDFLAPPSLRIDFPFVLPDFDWPGTLPEGYFLDSSTTGALAHSPYLLVLLGLPWVLRGAPVREGGVLRRRLLALVAAGLSVPLATSFAFASTAMRFQADFLYLLVVPALVLWFVLARRVSGRRRWLFRTLTAIVYGWSAFAAVAISITGVDPLRRSNPDLFASLERKAEPLRRLAGLFARGSRLEVPLRVAFPERTVAEEEPFLSWGPLAGFDVLRVSTLSPGVFAFTLDTARARSRPPATPPSTPGLRFEPGRFYDVVVELDRVERRVHMTVDGVSRFELAGSLVPLASRHVWPGRGPRGHGARDLGRFSGTMIPEAMWLAGPPGLEALPPIAPSPVILTASKKAPPDAGTPGQLWAVAGQRGASIFTGEGWRWIPTASFERVTLEHRIGEQALGLKDTAPVLVSGNGDGADAIVVRPLDRQRVAIALARWDGSWTVHVEGAPIARSKLAEGAVRVVLDRPARLVRVTLDGEELLRAGVELAPLRAERMHVGRVPRRKSGRQCL